jgi:hypothetical protein
MTPEGRNGGAREGVYCYATARSTSFRCNGYASNNRGIVENDVSYSVRAKWLQRRVPLRIGSIPCGGGVEYLHLPVSCRRRRKWKSLIRDSKILWRVPQDSDPRMTMLARASSNCKRLIRPLVRESAPHQQNSNCLTVIKIWS